MQAAVWDEPSTHQFAQAEIPGCVNESSRTEQSRWIQGVFATGSVAAKDQHLVAWDLVIRWVFQKINWMQKFLTKWIKPLNLELEHQGIFIEYSIHPVRSGSANAVTSETGIALKRFDQRSSIESLSECIDVSDAAAIETIGFLIDAYETNHLGLNSAACS